MARFSAGGRAAGGSTTLPLASLYAGATGGGQIREIGLYNTTTTAVALYLARFTTAGTPGTGLLEAQHNPNGGPALCTAANSHTSTPPTLGDDLGYRCVLGAAIGAGQIWTFGDSGLVLLKGTANGIGILVSTGSVQIVDFYIAWDE